MEIRFSKKKTSSLLFTIITKNRGIQIIFHGRDLVSATSVGGSILCFFY